MMNNNNTTTGAPQAPYVHNAGANDNLELVVYWREMNNGVPCPVRFLDRPEGLVNVSLKQPITIAFNIPVLFAKSAIDFSRMAGVSIEVAVLRAACQFLYKNGTDWAWWLGWDERWSDNNVKISLNGGREWAECGFIDYMNLMMNVRCSINIYTAGQGPRPDVVGMISQACEQYKEKKQENWLSRADVAALCAVGGDEWLSKDKTKNWIYFNDMLEGQKAADAKAYIDIRTHERRVYKVSADMREPLLAELERRYQIAMHRNDNEESQRAYDELKYQVVEDARAAYMKRKSLHNASSRSWY